MKFPGRKENNMARWDDENFNMGEPAKDILCATCIHRLKPITVAGYTQDRAGYGHCDKFDNKPTEILWNGADCEYYEREE